MDMGIETPELHLRRNKLVKGENLPGLPFGPTFLDHVVKMTLEDREAEIDITRATVFDGLSLRTFDLTKGIENRIVVKGTGRTVQKEGLSLASLAQEGLETGASVAGVVSLSQIGRFGSMLLKAAGMGRGMSDGTFKARTIVTFGGKAIGEAVYSATKYNSLKMIPDFKKKFGKHVVPYADQEALLGMPVLITNVTADLDLKNVSRNRDGLVDVHFREDDEISGLQPSHVRDIVITTYYDVTVGEIKNPQHQKSGVLKLELGKAKYEDIAKAEAE